MSGAEPALAVVGSFLTSAAPYLGAAATIYGVTQAKKAGSASAAAPPPPTLEAPTAAPTPTGGAAAAAQKASILKQLSMRGRAASILTDQSASSDKLGG